jgi:hypothetical protein
MWPEYKLAPVKKIATRTILLLCFLFIFNSALLAAPVNGPDQIILSWTQEPLTTQTISWRAKTAGDHSQVQYLTAAEYSGNFHKAQHAIARRRLLGEGYFRFTCTLTGLEPGTAYVYRLGGTSGWAEPASFTTAADTNSFSFLYLGDVQAGYESWGQMLTRIISQQPGLRFALLGGDLVDKGNNIQEWEQFFAAAEPLFKQIPLLPAVGNHDNTSLFRESFAVPPNGPREDQGTVYSFDYGNCHIIVLNSNVMGIPGTAGYDRLSGWLQRDLASSQKAWTIAVFHHPPYQALQDWRGGHLQTNWVPLLEQGGVDLVLNGHQHVYMRTKPLWQGEISQGGPAIVYIIGNSGNKHYAPGPDHNYIARQVAGVSNYQLIEIQDDLLTLTTKGANGAVLDQFTLTKTTTDQAPDKTSASAKTKPEPATSLPSTVGNIVIALTAVFPLPF